jgi:hypothetical protein
MSIVGENVVLICRKGVPSSVGMSPGSTTATSVSPPAFPTEMENGIVEPVFQSPLIRRLALHVGALELGAAEDDVDEAVTEVAKVVLELEISEDDAVEESETVEVADELTLEEIPEPGCTSPQGGNCSTAFGLYRIEN